MPFRPDPLTNVLCILLANRLDCRYETLARHDHRGFSSDGRSATVNSFLHLRPRDGNRGRLPLPLDQRGGTAVCSNATLVDVDTDSPGAPGC